MYMVIEVRLTEIHTAEPLVPEPSPFEVEMAIEKLESYKSPGTDQIRGDMIKATGRAILSEIQKLNNSIRSKEELLHEWKRAVSVPVYKKDDKPDCSSYRGTSPFSNMIQHLSVKVKSIRIRNY
jgi:hypothetical protein